MQTMKREIDSVAPALSALADLPDTVHSLDSHLPQGARLFGAFAFSKFLSQLPKLLKWITPNVLKSHNGRNADTPLGRCSLRRAAVATGSRMGAGAPAPH